MTTIPLLAAVLCLAPASPQDDLFLSQKFANVEVQFVPSEMSEEEAEMIGNTFEAMRELYEVALGITPPDDLQLTLRVRQSTAMFYYTNGASKAFIDFPNAGFFRPARPKNTRIEDMARRIWGQLWLFRLLETTGGLDPRILQSIIDYHSMAQAALENPGQPLDGEQAGLGTLWLGLEQIYGPGTAAYLFSSLSGEKLRADQLGNYLRKTATLVLEDEAVRDAFDLITIPDPIFTPEDVEPGEPIAEGVSLRPSRMSLFNGVQLIDDATEPLSAGDRVRDFQAAFSLVVQCYPTRTVAAFPPKLNGHDLFDVYFEFRPRVERARDNIDFYLVMREFASRFEDRWVNILSPQATPLWRGVVGLKLTAIGDRVHVAKVTEGSEPEQAGIEAGMELLEIDGRPVGEVWSQLQHFFSITSSCGSDRESRARSLNVLLTGAESRPATLKFGKAGSEIEVELARGLPGTKTEAEGPTPTNFVESELREDGVGVIKVKVFHPGAVAQFKAALDGFAKEAKGVVVDLRGVDQGNPGPAFTTLALFLSEELALGQLAHRNPAEPPGTVLSQPVTVKTLNGIEPYTGKVALLVDTWTAGAAELFALGFEQAERGKVFGARSAGAMNQPMQPINPWQTLSSSGLVLSLTQNIILGPGNEPILGKGIEPDVACEVSANALAEGEDTVLETAAASF